MLRSSVIVALLAAGSACGSAHPTASQPVDLESEVTLARGETAIVKGQDLEVGFVEVTEDSRCPRDVQCVWAGEVKVRLSLRRGTEAPTPQEVREGEAAALGEYRVIVVKVLPYPTSTRPARPEEYRVTLKVSAS